MTSKSRAILMAMAAALMFPLAARAAGGASTPEGVFENFKTAMKNKDYKSGYAQMTPDSQDMMLGGLAISMTMGPNADPAKAAEAQKVADKYGVKKIDVTKLQPGQDPASLVKESVADVKDKAACFADMMTWMENNAAGKDRAEKMEAYSRAELTDLKIEGDIANGMVKLKRNGQENSNPMSFKKIGGNWYIDLVAQAGPPGHHAAGPAK
jgi:hypothetical protein